MGRSDDPKPISLEYAERPRAVRPGAIGIAYMACLPMPFILPFAGVVSGFGGWAVVATWFGSNVAVVNLFAKIWRRDGERVSNFILYSFLGVFALQLLSCFGAFGLSA